MFDSQLLMGEVVDLDPSSLWQNAVMMAKVTKRLHDESAKRVRELRADHQYTLSDVVWAGECQHYGGWKAAAYIMQQSIKERTRQEREQAAAVVKVGGARFLAPSCAGETCMDCERPIWQHILLDVGGELCPFGREFWTFARAITGAMTPNTGEAVRDVLKIIAKR